MNVRDLVPWGRGRLTTGEPFHMLQRDINRLFDDMWGGFDLPALLGRKGFPALEVRDEGKEIKVVAELPGMGVKDVELTIDAGILTLKGERKSETTEKTDGGLFSERWYGRFERSVNVGQVEEDKVVADFSNGVLTVILPKAAVPEEMGRKIPIGGTN
jgi:HSP20 family protein